MTFRLRDGLSIGSNTVVSPDGELIGNDFYYENTLPSVAPSLNLNFLTKKLDPRVTFSRGSTATYYNGKTSVIAEQNLLKYSNDFSNGIWLNGGGTVTRTAGTTDPFGGTSAYTLSFPANLVYTSQAVTWSIVSGTLFTASIWVRNASSGLNLRIFRDGSGTVESTSVSIPVSSSWQKISISYTFVNTQTGVRFDILNYTGGSGASVEVYGAQLENRSFTGAYIPTTTTAAVTYIPVLQTAAINQPRFDHDPITGECKGLLVEESRTNLFQQSATFSVSPWVAVRTTVSENAIIAPDGTLTADKIVETVQTNNSYYVYQSVSLTSGTTYTFSVYAKAAERSFMWIRLYGTGSWGNVSFNLTTGAINNPDGAKVSAQYVGNGWWRCVVTAASDLTGVNTPRIYVENDINASGYTGVAGYGIYVWGAQLEEGLFATSYIPTTTLAVTRSADYTSLTGTNFSSWFNQTEGTLVADCALTSVDSIRGIMYIGDGGPNTNYIDLRTQGDTLRSVVYSGNSQQNYMQGRAPVQYANVKLVTSYKQDDFAFTVNGDVPMLRTGNVPISPNTMLIGKLAQTNNYFLTGTFKRIAYYPKRLSNAELQAITL